jgi:hypothetical protein
MRPVRSDVSCTSSFKPFTERGLIGMFRPVAAGNGRFVV